MLVHPVEERANVTIFAESVRWNLQRFVRGFHTCHLDSERDAARNSKRLIAELRLVRLSMRSRF